MKEKLIAELKKMISEVKKEPLIREQLKARCRGYLKAIYEMKLIDAHELHILKIEIDKL